jgi:NAD(P)-dependent dehydrogenase (short-subunit alcohol dehydrogenase family)
MQLENKIAVITGASRGIGKAIALGFAAQGAKIVVASRKQNDLDAVVAKIQAAGGKAIAVATHTGDPDQCKALIDQAVQYYGGVHILVNNAATNPHFGPMMTAEASQWQKIMEVNVFGYYWLARYAAEAMQAQGTGGKIINMASLAGIAPAPLMGVYSVSKAAVIMLTKVLAQELGHANIQVNAIAPGIIKTKFAQALWENPQINQRYTERNPVGRIGDSQEVVAAALFLAGDGSSYMTGDVLMLDGGQNLMAF